MNQWHWWLTASVLSEYFSGKLGVVMTPDSCFVKFPPHSAEFLSASFETAGHRMSGNYSLSPKMDFSLKNM